MSARDTVVSRAVGQYFKPVDMSRAARRILFAGIGTAVLIASALTAPSPLSWLLWVWVAHRGFALAITLTVVGPAIQERERRLSNLPESWRHYLINGSVPRGKSEVSR